MAHSLGVTGTSGTPAAGTTTRTRTEIRWFLPPDQADALRALLPAKRPERRVDTYLLAPHEPACSVKLRGPDDRPETKRLVRPPVAVTIAGTAEGWAQRWRKEITAAPEGGPPAVAVRKTRWRRRVLEVVELEADGAVAWSVALVRAGGKLHQLVRRAEPLLEGWEGVAELTLERSMAYGEWLARVHAGSPPR